jgi:apolipoprotein N-acyltransferase
MIGISQIPSQTRIALLAGALSGGLLVLAMPRPDFGLLAYLALVPALTLLPGAGRSRVLLIGGAAGSISCAGKIYWIAETLSNYGGLSPAIGWLSTILLIAYLSLYFIAFCALMSRLDPASPRFPWFCAAIWVTLEWLQAHLLTGFPWMLLGYTQHRVLPILQTARIWGVYGVSFLIVLINGSMASLQIAGRPAWRGALAPALLLLIALFYGRSSLNTSSPEHTLKIGVVQGSIPQGEKWRTDARDGTVERYAGLTRGLAGAQCDFIVLPETAFPFYFKAPENAPYYDTLTGLARELETPMLVGSLERMDERIYNRAFLISGTGEEVGHQDKVHLVPFGEYLPFEWIFGYLEGLTRESGRFTPGQAHRALRLPEKDLPFGVFICYESIFPEIARAYANDGAEFLVNVTNDAWFGTTAAPYQHFAMGVFRAVENGLPLVRSANTGISGAVDASGRTLARTGLFEPRVFTAQIAPRRERTFYTRYGDLLVIPCMLLTAVAWFYRRKGNGSTK